MNKILSSLSQFNRREQTALLLGVAVLVLYLFWMLVLSPLQHKRELLLSTNQSTEASLGRVQLMAHKLELLQQSNQSTPQTSDIGGVVNVSLQENGLVMNSFTPGANGEARVRIDKAASEPMMQWLYDLEVKHHLAIKELSIAATNDPGQVSINVRLIKP
jgi:general secretion pathway protein M